MTALMTSWTSARLRASTGTRPRSSAATTSAALRLAGRDAWVKIHWLLTVTRPRRASWTSEPRLTAAAIATAAIKAYALLEPLEANCHVIARRFGIQRVLDDCHGSMNILDVLDRNGPMRFDNSDERIPAAKRLLQATDCVVDARLRHGEEVIRRYELCVALRPDWARAYLSLARYFDLLATAR